MDSRMKKACKEVGIKFALPCGVVLIALFSMFYWAGMF